jgi:hypothetical protein
VFGGTLKHLIYISRQLYTSKLHTGSSGAGFDINVLSIRVHAIEESWGVYRESWGKGVVGERREEAEEINDMVGDSLNLNVPVLVEVDAPVSIAQATI